MKQPNHFSHAVKHKTLNRVTAIVKYTTGLCLLATLITFYACEEPKTNDDLGVNQQIPVFNMDLFEQNLQDYVNWGDDEPIGWAYVISKDGNAARSAAFGDARTPVDGVKQFTVNKKINMASVSKFYTAIAVMQLLEKNNLSINSPVAPHLPGGWVKGPGVDDLRFWHLLKHQSGLQSTNSNFSTTLSYAGIQQCIQTGVVNSQDTRTYLNVNYGLFRILIPSLQNKLPNGPTTNLSSDEETQAAYIAYMQEYVFGPSGLSNINCLPEGRLNGTLYYNVSDGDNGTNGLFYDDWTSMSGGGGYFMTVAEMAAVSAYFENTESLVSKASRDIMREHRIGMDRQFASEEKHGQYYSKNGSISNAGQGVLTQIVHFPENHVECSVAMNTQGVTFRNAVSLRRLIVDAYNDAWVTP